MLSFCFKKPYLQYNKELFAYCRKSTEDSIKRICEKHALEKNKIKINNLIDTDNTNENEDDDYNKKSNRNKFIFIYILSISTIGFLLYKRIK